MGETTGIQWTDKTWNPWYGCSKVSPGCAHCYMFREAKQYGRDPEAVTRSKTKFSEPLKWREPARVFTCSWSDWFHEAADGWRDAAWAIVRKTPHLTYQILTKRPERIAEHLPADWGDEGEGYGHVWFGVSAEYQRQLEERTALLTGEDRLANNVTFVSAEPLLGPLDYWRATWADTINWFIIGGESGGREARRFEPDWARRFIAQVREDHGDDRAYGRVFVKQLGSVWAREHKARDWHGGDWSEWPADLRIREFPEWVP